MAKIKAWTFAYRPFAFGPPNQPVAAEVEGSGPHELGCGFYGYVITSPAGRTFVVEMRSGAIVGPSLDEVRADIRTARRTVMVKQVNQAVEQGKYAQVVTADEFWQMLDKSKPEEKPEP